MTPAQRHHLRRLLGWLLCDIGQSPEEMRETLRKIAEAGLAMPSEAAQQRLLDAYEKAKETPKYVRAAIKALQPLTASEGYGIIIDAEAAEDPLAMFGSTCSPAARYAAIFSEPLLVMLGETKA